MLGSCYPKYGHISFTSKSVRRYGDLSPKADLPTNILSLKETAGGDPHQRVGSSDTDERSQQRRKSSSGVGPEYQSGETSVSKLGTEEWGVSVTDCASEEDEGQWCLWLEIYEHHSGN